MRVMIALLALGIACGPARAQTLAKPECTEANISSANEKIGKMPDGTRKTTALSELASAKKALEGGRAADCQGHLLKADVQTK